MSKKKFTVYLVGVILTSIAANLVHPVTPTLIVERGLDSSMFGVALAAMQVIYFLFAPFWGRLCDYIPTRTVILICCCGYAVGQLIFGSAQTEAQVVGGRMFAGIFCGGVFTAFLNYIVNTSDPETRSAKIIAYSTANNVSNAVGYFVGGMLGLVSVEFAFGTQVVMLIGCGIFFRFLCIDDTPFKHKPEHPLTFKDANPFGVFISAKSFMTGTLLLLFITVAIGNLGQTAYEQVFNYYIKDQLGLSSAYNGIFKAIIAALTFLVNSTIVMKVIKKTDTNLSIIPVLVASIVPLALVFVVKDVVPFAICDIVFFVLAAVRMTMFQNIFAGKGTPETSNRVMGFFQSMTALGGIFGAFFAGIMYKTDPMSPFALALAAVTISAALALIYAARYKNGK
ncbi:MAG: MFS transporter [Firmicutes bacterium]|nr:MFS transporter [Bacillota bacterium]MBQ3577532.1 MFS transporter [Bacillota bacterium]MBQ6013224.1 MFS transporter [Bacillota bacterium]MBR0522067.1 MFS transporter [Bacillota bacterium]